MEDADRYALIQEVIPNKKCIPFRERFAKLTLSSHKKQHPKADNKAFDAEMPSVSSVRRQLNKDNNIFLPLRESNTDNSKKNTVASLNFSQDFFGQENGSNRIEETQMESEGSSLGEDSIITVSESDSSDNHESNVKPFDSTTKSSSNTFINNSMDRIANFLRDVSITNKDLHHRESQESRLSNASECKHSKESLTKAHLLAIADTESMHELLEEEESDLCLEISSRSILIENKQTKENDSPLTDAEADLSIVCNSIISSNCNQSDESNSWRADDDINITANSTQSESVNLTAASIIIEDTDESTKQQCSIEENSNGGVDDSSELCIQHVKPNINIAAKINIQINISSEIPHYYDDQAVSSIADHRTAHSSSRNDNPKNKITKTTNKLHQADKLRKQYSKCAEEDVENDSDKPIHNDTNDDKCHVSESIESNVSAESFSALDAEKLLTELYGHSWQTPDIMQTIRCELSSRNKSKTNQSRKCLFGNDIKANGINANLIGELPETSEESSSSCSNRKYSSEEKLINRPKAYQTRYRDGRDIKISKNIKKIDNGSLRSPPPKSLTACSPNVNIDRKTNTKKSQRKDLTLKSQKNDLPNARNLPLRRGQNKASVTTDKFNSDKQCPGETKRRLFTPNCYDDVSEEEVHKNDEFINSHENSTINDILEDECYDPINNCFIQTKGNDTAESKEHRNHQGSNLKHLPERAEVNIATVKPTVNAKLTSDTTKKNSNFNKINIIQQIQTPNKTYSFLKSLDECVSKAFSHPEALSYRENYRSRKGELSKVLYDLYNERLFDNKLDVPINWNKKLTKTAGRCINKKRMGIRASSIELSDKVLSSAERLRCTLLHELCHAATWIFNGENGHGATWKKWARKANEIFPDIPKIGICHQYDIQYKYTYKCTTCGAKSRAHSKSKKVENIRCSYCHSSIAIFLNKITKDGNVVETPVRQPIGFAKFVKDNYKKHRDKQLKHADIMKMLSEEFAAIKLT